MSEWAQFYGLASHPPLRYWLRRMKKLLLCSIVTAFACAAVQAGDDKAKACPSTAKASTCESACSAKKLTKKADSTAKGATQLLAKR